MFCVRILLNNNFYINNHLNWGKKVKSNFLIFNGFTWIRIRPIFDTDPDPVKLYGFHGSGSATLPTGTSKDTLGSHCRCILIEYGSVCNLFVVKLY